MGFVTLTVVAVLILLFFLPLLFLRRFGSLRNNEPNHSLPTVQEAPGLPSLPRSFICLGLLMLGGLLLVLWAMSLGISWQSEDTGLTDIILLAALPLHLPWLLGLFYNWKKGIFSHES